MSHVIAKVRDSVCAVVRIVPLDKAKGQFRVGVAGTAWCISEDRYLVTAHHILNEGKPRDTNDRFYIMTVPGNGSTAYEFAVVGFPVEDPTHDLAILEMRPSAGSGQHVPAVPVTFARPVDGAPVLTYGFPAPTVNAASVTADGEWRGGQMFLKGHANEGMVAAQYDAGGAWLFEFNVGWHHGESGGPVFQMDPIAVFAVMQHYRNVQTPNGVQPGPHRGYGLEVIRQHLITHGAAVL